MAIAERSVETTWKGTFAGGGSTVSASSRAWETSPVTCTAERLSIVRPAEVDRARTVVSSALRVRGRVPGVDRTGFQPVVDEAAALYPVSRLFAGATVSVATEFEPA